MTILTEDERKTVEEMATGLANQVQRFTGLKSFVEVKFIPTGLDNNGDLTEDEFIYQVKNLCINAFEVDNVGLLSKSTRIREVTDARQVCMYLLDKHTKFSLKKIGILFGGRDHSTVIHAKQKVGDMMDTEKKFREKVTNLDIIVSGLKISSLGNSLKIHSRI